MSEKIRWGVLSTAKIAKSAMIPAIRESRNGEVIAVASRNLEKAQAFADEMKLPKAYGSYEELLGDPEIDAIYNPLPVSLHALWCLRCAEAGKPVLCEKPFTLNADEARQVVDAFAQRNLLVAESLMYRYHPLTRTFLKLLADGAVGELHMVYAQFNASAGGDDIRMKKAMGGGGLLDLGCYSVSIIRHMAGEEPDVVQSVATYNDDGVDVQLTGAMLFPSGVVGHFGCALETHFDCSYGASGSAGRLLIDHGATCAWPGEAFKIKHWKDEQYEEIETPAANHYTMIAEDFGDALQQNKPMEFSLDDTLANMKALDRVAASAEANRK